MRERDNKQEADLIEQVRAGHREAFGQLVEPHIPRLLGLARRMLGNGEEAEDALQNALASTWIARAKLDPAMPVAAFLTTVTLNKCRDRLRRRKVKRLIGLDVSEPVLPVADEEPDAEAKLADRQALENTWQAIERLPLRLREALILVAVEGRSQREVAELLGVTEKAIETRIYRARQRLREKLNFV